MGIERAVSCLPEGVTAWQCQSGAADSQNYNLSLSLKSMARAPPTLVLEPRPSPAVVHVRPAIQPQLLTLSPCPTVSDQDRVALNSMRFASPDSAGERLHGRANLCL